MMHDGMARWEKHDFMCGKIKRGALISHEMIAPAHVLLIQILQVLIGQFRDDANDAWYDVIWKPHVFMVHFDIKFVEIGDIELEIWKMQDIAI